MTNTTKTKCDKCGAEAVSIPNTQHRRCGGSADAKSRPKRQKLGSNERGVWR